MNPMLTDTVIRFARIIIAAALVALAGGVLSVDLTLGLKGIAGYLAQAVWVAIIHSATEFARTYFGVNSTVTLRGRAGALRVRGKTFWDWLPI